MGLSLAFTSNLTASPGRASITTGESWVASLDRACLRFSGVLPTSFLVCPSCAVPWPDENKAPAQAYLPSNPAGQGVAGIEIRVTKLFHRNGQCQPPSWCDLVKCKGKININIKNTTGQTITYTVTPGGAAKTLVTGASTNVEIETEVHCDNEIEYDIDFSWTVGGVNKTAKWEFNMGCSPCPTGPV